MTFGAEAFPATSDATGRLRVEEISVWEYKREGGGWGGYSRRRVQ